MIRRYRISSVITVNCKYHLLLPSIQLSSYVNEQNLVNKISRLKVLIPKTELTQSKNAHLTHFFCSIGLKIAANFGFLFETKQLHSNVTKLGYYMALSMQNQILYAYVKCWEFQDADKVFDEMPLRNIVTWNAMISGGVYKAGLGFCYFKRMLVDMVQPDSTTMNALFRSNGVFEDLGVSRQLHGFAMKVGLSMDPFVGCAIVDLYGKFGIVRDADFAFEEIGSRDLVVWNVMVSVCGLNGLVEEGVRVYKSMQLNGVQGDEFTFTSLLSSCNLGGSCELFKQFQGLVIKLSFDLDLQVGSALVDLYAKNGSVNDARKLFDMMVVRSLVTWNTMIVGYGQQGYGNEAMELFVEMLRRNVKPDDLTIASILSSCGNLAAISKTSQIHAYAMTLGVHAYLSVANSLIVAYSNCGCLANASLCFHSTKERDLITWTSILNSYAFHGHVKQSIQIFEMMISSGLNLDNIAFLGILSACSRGGFVREGICYFRTMIMDYNIMPSSEHYACLISLLGNAGLMEEASGFLNSEPMALDSNALVALIKVFTSYEHFELAQWAVEKLFELEPGNSVNYTVMSNMYASVGQWYDAARVRKKMKQKCDSKLPGSSWIEISG